MVNPVPPHTSMDSSWVETPPVDSFWCRDWGRLQDLTYMQDLGTLESYNG